MLKVHIERSITFLQSTVCARLQNSRVFFLKISKEIGKAWRKSLTRASLTRQERLSPVSLSVFSLIPDLLFDCSRVLEYAKTRTVLQSMFVPNTGIYTWESV